MEILSVITWICIAVNFLSMAASLYFNRVDLATLNAVALFGILNLIK